MTMITEKIKTIGKSRATEKAAKRGVRTHKEKNNGRSIHGDSKKTKHRDGAAKKAHHVKNRDGRTTKNDGW